MPKRSRRTVDDLAPAPHLDHHLASTLDVLDDAVNYMGWIVELIEPYLEGPLLEVGAGHGTFTERLATIGRHVVALEPGVTGSQVLAARFEDHPGVEVASQVVEELPRRPTFASAVMINVLEHIEDDRGTVAAIRDRLIPGGHLAVWVPAFQSLYSEFDRQIGHHRRYRRRPLLDVMESAGLTTVHARYVNLPGFFSWLVMNRLLGTTQPSPGLVKVFDRTIVPTTRAIESWVRVPFGQSLLVVGRKPLSDQIPTPATER